MRMKMNLMSCPVQNPAYLLILLQINNPGEDDVIGYVARMCMPDNYYYNGSLYLGGFDGYTPPPVITCVSNLMFTATGTTNNKGKGCGHMGKKGVIYNTINYQSVLYGPNDLSGYEDCVSDAGSGGFDYYQCWDKYYDTVITGITPRGPDFEKSKITDIEFEDDNEVSPCPD